jgi:hypothetical protein
MELAVIVVAIAVTVADVMGPDQFGGDLRPPE